MIKKILIVDDHPMVILGYQLILQHTESVFEMKFDGANTCSEVLLKMKISNNSFYDLVLLDISIPSSDCKSANDGEDLGFYIRKKYPNTKIIVQTGLSDVQRITNIFNTLKPDGFIIKPDINEEVLVNAVETVLNNKSYFSESFEKLLSHDNFEDIYLDNWNRKILYFLSLGYKMKDLPNHLPFSLPTIERRKKEIKLLLGVQRGGNKELLEVARNKGFV